MPFPHHSNATQIISVGCQARLTKHEKRAGHRQRYVYSFLRTCFNGFMAWYKLFAIRLHFKSGFFFFGCGAIDEET
jgi:hypothetical protein